MSKTGLDARPLPQKSPAAEKVKEKSAAKEKINLTTTPIVPGEDTIIEIVKVCKFIYS